MLGGGGGRGITTPISLHTCLSSRVRSKSSSTSSQTTFFFLEESSRPAEEGLAGGRGEEERSDRGDGDKKGELE